MISAIVDPALRYPLADDFFSPDEAFPEYPFEHVAAGPNPVYRAVREVLAQAGLDAARYGSAAWNPLGEWVRPGQRVFVLCNFVYHRRGKESAEAFSSKCTHASVVRAIIDYIYIAVGPSGRVRFGNAAVQSCSWKRVLEETGAARMRDFYRDVGAPIDSADLRLFVDERPASLVGSHVERRDDSAAVTIDLGRRSMLAALDDVGVHYRVSDYRADRTENFHRDGSHRYVIHREVLDSDVIVSVPKLKTHEKVGITCAVKGTVGAIGHKDCLAHHRRGAPATGGDEFRSDPMRLLSAFTSFHDVVQRMPPGSVQGRASRFALRAARRVVRRIAPTMNGAWCGNDTCWRMGVDIARLVQYARSDGSLDAARRRPHLVLVDGVVGGEGNGPLDPSPVSSGTILFADDAVTADYAAAQLMGLDPERFAIIREAARVSDMPLTAETAARLPAVSAVVNRRRVALGELSTLASHQFVLPRGWRAVRAAASRVVR